jgi:hypothetical protein
MLEREVFHYSKRGGPYGHLPDKVLIRDMTSKGHKLFGVMNNERVWSAMKSKFSPSEMAAFPPTVVRDVAGGLLATWAKTKSA